ncbi:MAG: hypothetical protein SFT81_00200 [Candidatus Caenarcaniphilales bacterium]|nr:hypothetical protein [Candidatus Caenarcaniphilales bacterium]
MYRSLQYACVISFILSSLQIAWAGLPGKVVVDRHNYWHANGRLADPNAFGAYIVCDGYLGSPLIPNTMDAINAFSHNCEVTPPPGALPIIDLPENHSTNYPGYPAYSVKSATSERVYFLCNGFLNSSSWCSLAAEAEAQRLNRSSQSRFWEQVYQPHPQRVTHPQVTTKPLHRPDQPFLPQPVAYLIRLDSTSFDQSQEAHRVDPVPFPLDDQTRLQILNEVNQAVDRALKPPTH